MTRPRRATAAGAVLLLAGFLLGGCGIPMSSGPQVVTAVPDALLSPASKHKPPPKTQNPGSAFDIFLAEGNDLVAVLRPGVSTPQALLSALEAGPTDVEATYGITTDIPSGTGASVVRVRGAVVTVNLEASFGYITTLAEAQIVFTLTQFKGIDEVLFYEAGSPVLAPTEDGDYVSRPLTRQDFAHFAAGVPLATTRPSVRCSPTGPRSGSGGGKCP